MDDSYLVLTFDISLLLSLSTLLIVASKFRGISIHYRTSRQNKMHSDAIREIMVEYGVNNALGDYQTPMYFKPS